MTPIRRVVTGEDAAGRSHITWDSAAPNVNVGRIAASAGMTDIWVFHTCPAPLAGARDDGNLPFSFEPPETGGHLRLVHSAGKPAGYDRASDTTAVPLHAPRLRPGASTWDKGGQNAFSSPVHRSETVDVGVLVQGRRTLLLDDGAYALEPGDVVVQLRNWHGWTNPEGPSLMAFVMLAATPGTDGDR
jgi:quercetin dioxygenase-like cupin family protein